MMSYFMSLPSEWAFKVEDLQQNCGRDKVYKIIKELRKAHYIERECTRKPDGTFVWGDYQIHERPFTENQEVDSGLSEPLPENPDTEDQEVKDSKTDHKKKPSGAKAPSEYKLIQAHTVEMQFVGIDDPWGQAGDVANWALARNEKKPWSEARVGKPFDYREWRGFMAYYVAKELPPLRKAQSWQNQAAQFRTDPQHDEWVIKANMPAEEPTTKTTAMRTREAMYS